MGVGARHKREEGRTARVFSLSPRSSYAFSFLVMAASAMSFLFRAITSFQIRRAAIRITGNSVYLKARYPLDIDTRVSPSRMLSAILRVTAAHSSHNSARSDFPYRTDTFQENSSVFYASPLVEYPIVRVVYRDVVRLRYPPRSSSNARCLQRVPYLVDTHRNRAHRYTLLPPSQLFSPLPHSPLGYTYVPCHRAPLPSSDTSSSSAQLLSSRRPLHLLPLPHRSSSSSSSASVLVVRSTPRSFAVSFRRLARAPEPAFLSPGNCSNFDPRDTARPVGMWTLRMCAPVSLKWIAHGIRCADRQWA